MLKRFFPFVFTSIFTIQAFAFSPVVPADSQIRIDSLKSEILKVTRKYSVYLPKSYLSHTEKRYPVLYLLHGLNDDYDGWLDSGNLQYIANHVFDAGDAREMVIIVPDAGTLKDGYFNTEGWPYETFFFDEFIPYIEKTYPVIADKQHRAIAGYSMGGGGAVSYALKHPGLFSSVYAMSALMTLPKQGRAPVMDPKMAELGQSVLANDCVAFVTFTDEATLEKLRTVRWFVDCGDDDFLLDANYNFFREMQNAKVPCELRVRDGNHNWEYWQSALYMALPFVSDGFGK